MKKLLACLYTVALITGCSTTPSSPKPHQTKYAFQCLQVSIPEDAAQAIKINNDVPDHKLTQPQIDMAVSHPEATIIRLPIVYAGIGESATNDQTETVEMPFDADIVDGEVVYEKKPLKVGMAVSVEVLKAEAHLISYKIHLLNRKLIGFDVVHRTEEGQEVKMPFFEVTEVNTKITQAADSWIVTGGMIAQQGTEPKIRRMLLIRVIAPTTE